MASNDSALLLDTSLLIDYLRGSPLAGRYLESKRGLFELICSHVSVAEMIVGLRSRSETRTMDRLLDRLVLEPVTAADSVRALKWLRKYHRLFAVDYHDCLIGAAASRLKAAVVTLNDRHFGRLPGITVVRPY